VIFLNVLVTQAVKKQFTSSGYESSDVVVIDEVEMQRHQQLEKLYRATRAGKVCIFSSCLDSLLMFEQQRISYFINSI